MLQEEGGCRAGPCPCRQPQGLARAPGSCSGSGDGGSSRNELVHNSARPSLLAAGPVCCTCLCSAVRCWWHASTACNAEPFLQSSFDAEPQPHAPRRKRQGQPPDAEDSAGGPEALARKSSAGKPRTQHRACSALGEQSGPALRPRAASAQGSILELSLRGKRSGQVRKREAAGGTRACACGLHDY